MLMLSVGCFREGRGPWEKQPLEPISWRGFDLQSCVFDVIAKALYFVVERGWMVLMVANWYGMRLPAMMESIDIRDILDW